MNRRLLFVVAVAAAIRIVWSLLLPFNAAPDEFGHDAAIRFFVRHGRLATLQDLDVTAYGFYMAQPPLPYLLHIVCGHFGLPLRVASVVLGTVSVALIGCFATRVFANEQRGLLTAVLVAAWPQMAFLSAYQNADIATVCLASYACLRAVSDDGRDWLDGVVIGLLLLCKPTGFAAIAFLGLSRFSWRRAWIIAGVAAIVALPLLVRNYIMLDGDAFGTHAVLGRVTKEWPAVTPFCTDTPLRCWLQLPRMILQSRYLINTFESGFGLFGRMDAKLPNAVYVLAFLAVCAAYRARVWRRLPWLVAIGLSIALHVYMNLWVDVQAQGRYFLPLAALIATALVDGWSRLLPRNDPTPPSGIAQKGQSDHHAKAANKLRSRR